jgi:hypothetical protein
MEKLLLLQQNIIWNASKNLNQKFSGTRNNNIKRTDNVWIINECS